MVGVTVGACVGGTVGGTFSGATVAAGTVAVFVGCTTVGVAVGTVTFSGDTVGGTVVADRLVGRAVALPGCAVWDDVLPLTFDVSVAVPLLSAVGDAPGAAFGPLGGALTPDSSGDRRFGGCPLKTFPIKGGTSSQLLGKLPRINTNGSNRLRNLSKGW